MNKLLGSAGWEYLTYALLQLLFLLLPRFLPPGMKVTYTAMKFPYTAMKFPIGLNYTCPSGF